MFANSIHSIEISSLWSGRKHIQWELRPDVNILSGKNGEGKSTIINRLAEHLRAVPDTGEIATKQRLGVKIEFDPPEATSIRYDVIRSFDRTLLSGENIAKIASRSVTTELDWQLYRVQRRYLDFQVTMGNRMIALLSSGTPEAAAEAAQAAERKTDFLNLVDELFADTGKTIDRTQNELSFLQYGEKLSPYLLSSGEKQMLLILLTVLTEDHLPYVLFMDEPEISLHFEWQKRLISLVRRLNPNAQIILTTHSPAIILDGWEDCVTAVGEISH